ncbi:MAG: hypothetical protein GDA65_11740 [Nitrospira sp. CR1.1]|nr:hypothetical protein [Nitrospira sp. CR1.1]
MNKVSPIGAASTTPTLDGYASALARSGRRVLPGLPGTFWIRYESYAMMRVPTFALRPPSPDELRNVLRRSRSTVATYLVEPDKSHPANAWLYVCHDRSYRLENLGVAGRRDARRAGRSLRIEFVDWPTVMAHGFTAFSETRTRVGLSDGTFEQFQNRFRQFSLNPFHCAVGAWQDDSLVAFMTLVVVDDWVEIEGSFSADGSRTLCPNDGLAHFVLSHFLVKRGCHTVSYGLSSIQDAHQAEGLHNYKKKVGFDARPVHRAFLLHPVLRPFASPLMLRGAKMVSNMLPHNRLLKKASGVLGALAENSDAASRS